MGGGRLWESVVREAEKLVGYPSSYKSLKYLMNDEFASVAVELRKLLGTKHPLLATAKEFFNNEYSDIQLRGLSLLLISQAGNSTLKHRTKNFNGGINDKGVLDVEEMDNENMDKLKHGNKIAVLSGDFLLANTSTALAKLGSPIVTEMIANSIADMATAGYYSICDRKSTSQSPACDNVKAFRERCYLESGSLLAHSCKASLHLVDAPPQLQDTAFLFGKDLAFAIECAHQKSNILNPPKNNGQELLTTTLSSDELSECVSEYGNSALGHLKNFSECAALTALSQLVSYFVSQE